MGAVHRPPVHRRQGVVTAITVLPVDGVNKLAVLVDVGGEAGPVRVLEPYSPAIGDTVEMLEVGGDWIVIGRLAAASMRPVYSRSSTDIAAITSTTPAAGSPVVGTTFVCPPSALIKVTITGQIEQSQNSHLSVLGWEIRLGATIGSGTVVYVTSQDRAVTAGRAVAAGGVAMNSASHEHHVDTLGPGFEYNIRAMHWVTNVAGTMAIYYREISVEMVP
jgi:hypothetical protein